MEVQTMKKCLTLMTVLLAGFVARTEPNKDFPKVDDTSFTEANGSRVIRLSADIAAAPEEVWRLITTAEGWKKFAVAYASVDLRVGGIIETSYDPKAKQGDPDNIKNQVVAYVPGRMLAIHCIQTPHNFEHKEEFFSTATVLEVVPAEKGKCRVLMTAAGYLPGAAYDDLFKHFRWGDAYTLEKLRATFEPGPSAASGQIVDANTPALKR